MSSASNRNTQSNMQTIEPIDFKPLALPVRWSDPDTSRRLAKIRRWMPLSVSLSVLWLTFLILIVVANPPAAAGVAVLLGVTLFFTAFPFSIHLRRIKEGIRVRRFAEANGFTFEEKMVRQEAGSVFNVGRSRSTRLVVGGMYAGHPFWFGKHRYVIRSGKSQREITTGVVAVTLPRALPYVMLDGRQNTHYLGSDLDRSQRLELEGDFNKYFVVYCPKDYERDVLYFLTPELMQAMIDMDDVFDIEIIGNTMYFYRYKEIPLNETELKKVFLILEKIGGEVVENSSRYQDHRVDKAVGTVAPEGLRLKKSVWPMIIGGIATVVFLYLHYIATFE